MTNVTKQDSSSEPRETTGKKPYKTPTFHFEQVFEVTALSCGKIDATQGSCQHNRKIS
jgi:hypothetical protein